jgi:hypothetical protein
VELCHVVDRATPTNIVSVFRQRASDEADYLVQIKSLEYSWGLQRPFHVDTRYNFLFRTSGVCPKPLFHALRSTHTLVGADYHYGFDNGKFILLPCAVGRGTLVTTYIDCTKRTRKSPSFAQCPSGTNHFLIEFLRGILTYFLGYCSWKAV